MKLDELQPVPAEAQSLTLQLPGLQVAALAWGEPTGRPLLALHGWLDNAMTFARLAPALAAAGYRVVAPDLVGHGLSDWRAPGQTYAFMDKCFDVQAIALALGWPHFTLLGHSMGAGIASLLAGARPQQVEALILLDGIGGLVPPNYDPATQLGRALSRWIGHQQQQHEIASLAAVSVKAHASIQDAAKARMKGVGAVDFDAALLLCQRALRPLDDARATGGWFWRSDPRLLHPSPWHLTEEQNLSFMRAVQAPALLVLADAGLLVQRPEIETRFQNLRNAQKSIVSGGHHLHLEASSSDAVIREVLRFLQ